MSNRFPRVSAAGLLAAALVWTAGILPAQAQGGQRGRGATLFWNDDFQGRSRFFDGDHSNLGQTSLGHDQASSIILDQGCRVTLYAQVNFGGKSVTLTANERHLAKTGVGDNAVSSLQVNCGPGSVSDSQQRDSSSGGAKGATVFWRDDFQGRSQFFNGDHPNLGSTAFGDDQASSVILDQGCQVTLYEQANYGGKSVQLTANERHLGQTAVGNDKVSSLQVSCR